MLFWRSIISIIFKKLFLWRFSNNADLYGLLTTLNFSFFNTTS